MLLTRRQKEVLDFVTRFVRKHRYSPSLEEIAGELGLASISTVHKHVSGLVEKGLLRRGWNRNRSLEPVKPEHRPRAVRIPLAGTVTAGRPLEYFEDADPVEIPESLLGRGETFALLVKGDGLLDEGIRDGDHLVVERRGRARGAQTVLALIDGRKATVRSVHLRGGQVRLMPSPRSFKSLSLAAHRLRMVGVVLGVVRRYRRQPG
jgi:repressor LexA